MKNKVYLIVFIIAIIIVSILKQLLAYDLPIAANVGLAVDDMLMINMTDSIVNGKWIGGYNDVILSKGPTFPLILVAIYYLKIDYITMMTVLYTLSCLCLIHVLSKRIKNKFLIFAIYLFTIFTPIMYCYQVMQRVYRNAIIPSLAIFIISGYLYLFFTRNDENKTKWRLFASICTGLALALFWYTREDSIWMLPFIIFMSVMLVLAVIIKNKKINKEFFYTLLILIIPLIMVFAYKNIICYQNYKHFGVYTVYNNEYYNKAMDSLRKVKKYDYYDNIDFPTAKLKKVAEVTCLKNIYGSLEGLVYGYSLFDSGPLDGEVVNGWFPWAFRGALLQNGYYANAQETNNFFNTLHVQIEEALENGTLEREDEKKDIKTSIDKLFYEVGRTFKTLYAYDDIAIRNEKIDYYQNDVEGYKKYAKYTKNKFFIYNKETNEDVYYLDNMENYQENITPKINFINDMINLYKTISGPIFSVGVALYVLLTVLTIVNMFKKKYEILEIWIAMSGILGAFLTLVFGIAYETAFNAYVITAMYLSAAYPLMIIFGTSMIGYFIIKVTGLFKNRKKARIEVKAEN